uniref:Try1a n=1 Tax=Tomicus yunnanensis TaxID=768153 RepID=A0A6B8V2D5_9CUCU|nr:Try1a [Tomicus yunnanensis]
MAENIISVVFLAIFGFQLCSGAVQDLSIDTRIVGGEEVDIESYPYQVSLQYSNQHFCGGALVTRNTVLSAAHCFGSSYTSLTSSYVVKYGSNTTSGAGIQIDSVLVHPNFTADALDCDIALIKLKSNVTISASAALIRISESTSYTSGSYASVTGWGYQQENGTVSSLLRGVNVPLTSASQCEKSYANIINITANMICAGYSEGGKDACQGDSGGPLVQKNKLIGVVSFGAGCARKSYPGVYTNVGRLLDWVVENSNYSRNNTADPAYVGASLKNCGSLLLAVFAVINCILLA